MSDIPEHRSAIAPRNGDDHVIGEDGELRNVEQEARDAAAAEAAAEDAPRKRRKATEPDGEADQASD